MFNNAVFLISDCKIGQYQPMHLQPQIQQMRFNNELLVSAQVSTGF